MANPKGNPNPNIGKERKTGALTDETKLKGPLLSGFVRPGYNNKLLRRLSFCDLCPLRQRTVMLQTAQGAREMTIPARCPSWKEGHEKCVINEIDMINKLRFYYKVGEKFDTLKLQEAITYDMLENAELSKQASLLQDMKPGFEAAKFQEIAGRNLEALNKIKYGELNRNVNINIETPADMVMKRIQDFKQKEVKEEENGQTKS